MLFTFHSFSTLATHDLHALYMRFSNETLSLIYFRFKFDGGGP